MFEVVDEIEYIPIPEHLKPIIKVKSELENNLIAKSEDVKIYQSQIITINGIVTFEKKYNFNNFTVTYSVDSAKLKKYSYSEFIKRIQRELKKQR